MSSSNPLDTPYTHKLIQRFEWNARYVFEDPAGLYFRLSRELIGDGKLLVLASHVPSHQPAPNLFFSAVHYLLMREEEQRRELSGITAETGDKIGSGETSAGGNTLGGGDKLGGEETSARGNILGGGDKPPPLREFFPDLTANPNTTDDPYPVFREYCLTHAVEIRKLLETRRVQVNEIARCACFLPGFQMVSQRSGGKPLAVIEVGSSAGLNLLWDRYAYDYGDGQIYGARDSDIVLTCELRGDIRPPLPATLPAVALRFGIDLHPIDVQDMDAMLWLRALVWPEHLERAQRLEQAIDLANQRPPLVMAGDALEVVPRALDAISPDTPVLFFHSYVLNQFSSQARAHYFDLLAEHSKGRRLYDLAMEPKDWPSPLVLTTYEDGGWFEQTLAVCDHFARWMEWLG